MKQLLILTLLFISAEPLRAQTEAETLEWLNTKKDQITYIMSNTVSCCSGKLLLTNDQLKAHQDEGAYKRGNWSSIKDVKVVGDNVRIIFDFTYEDKPSYIQCFISDTQLHDKYVKALKHMATLKGAKLVKDDMF